MNVATVTPLPDSLRYFIYLNAALYRGKCPVAEALLVEGAFYQTYYEHEKHKRYRNHLRRS